jgi:predicted small lipoprotein YifL
LSVIAAVAGACLLSACGRKGPLDPPPGRVVLEQQRGVAEAEQDGALLPDSDQQGRPVAPAGAKRRIPLDVLID